MAWLAGDSLDDATGKRGVSTRATVKTRAGGANPCVCSCNINGSSGCAGGARERAWVSGDTALDEPSTQTDATAVVMQADVIEEAEHPGH